jgi:hypothetical protein
MIVRKSILWHRISLGLLIRDWQTNIGNPHKLEYKYRSDKLQINNKIL